MAPKKSKKNKKPTLAELLESSRRVSSIRVRKWSPYFGYFSIFENIEKKIEDKPKINSITCPECHYTMEPPIKFPCPRCDNSLSQLIESKIKSIEYEVEVKKRKIRYEV